MSAHKKCKTCHNKKKEAPQYAIGESSAHCNAYQTRASDEAKEMASRAGVKGNPQEANECLKYHVTGYELDEAMFAEKSAVGDGVQCESCHGPGSEYKAAKIMSSSKYKIQRDVQHELALEAGLVIPDEKTCTKCHSKRSPAFKGFNNKAYYEKIKHENDR